LEDVKALGNISRLLGDELFVHEELEASGEIENIEWEIEDKTGLGHSLLINVKRVNIKGGTVLYTCHDITELKKSEEEQSRLQKRLEAQWELARMVDIDRNSICNRVLTEIIDMTESRYGFYGFLNEDESVMTIHSWSNETMADCKMHNKPIEFRIKDSGVWGNAVRDRRSLIINNYNEEHLNKLGLPEGHVAINRLMAVPIFRHGRIVALGSVANKVTDYNEKDVEQINIFLHSAQIIQEKQMAEEELKNHRKHLTGLVEERTDELQKINEELELEISERTKAEKQLKLMALFAELNPAPVLRFDKNGNVLMANPAAVEILNLGTPGGKPLKSAITGIKEFDLTGCIENGTILSQSVQIGRRHFHFIFRGLPELGVGQIYGSDITDQMNAEAETIRASQLASLGELAASVAHEVNNPINGIINFAQILADKSDKKSKENEIANMIMHEGDRIASIVSSLLSFARTEKDEQSSVSVQEILTESLSLTLAQLKKDDIKLKLDIPGDLPEVTANFQQVEQVCLNIINNARYALNQKNGGEAKNKLIKIHAEMIMIDNCPYVRMVFFDNGTGIPESLLNKIQNPFFSTKPKGSGTGLGLSISQDIIMNHGGKLTVESVEGEFTKIKIDLPCKAGG
jgi:signal transduction histidine kinase